MPVRKDWRDGMPLDDLSETLKDLAIKVYLVQIPLREEQRVRELVKELKSLLDAAKTTDQNPIL
jgi:surfactin synthase thioesterase subunit